MSKPRSPSLTNNSHESCDTCPTKDAGFFCSFGEEITRTIDHIKIDSFYKQGEAIFRAGSPPEGIYSIRKGVVKVELLNESGRVNIISFLGAGGLLGYRSFFKDEPHLSTAVAVEDCEIIFLPKNDVKKLFQCHQELTMKLVSKLADDVKEASLKWVNQINKSAPGRVAEAILFLDEHFKDVYWTRKEIAEWSGTTQETVIRTLSAFEASGIIKKNPKNFSIIKYMELVDKSNK